MLTNDQENSLTNAENVLSGLMEKNFVASRSNFLRFQDMSIGLPLLIPADPILFDFKNSETFRIDDVELLDTFYGKRDKNYTGFQHSFYTNHFLSNIKLRPEIIEAYTKNSKDNYRSVQKIQELKAKHDVLAAFHTRNIPHVGHEAIIRALLEYSEHVVINPVIGPKKAGDLKLESLQKVYKYLATTKYNNKISFIPIKAMMFYAGPREAIHHAILRERLGFNLFTVGRDHAGADGFFNAADAVKIIKKVQHKIRIKIMHHEGAVFCPECDGGVLIGRCDHDRGQMVDVSGSEFRKQIAQSKMYKYADRDMQSYLRNQTVESYEI